MDWLDLLQECAQRVRRAVLPLLGSVEAGAGFGLGAGGDVIKRIDLVAEKALIDTLRDHGASCTLISEETGIKKIGTQPHELFLTVDPLDGTTNAVRGLPFMATSMAVSRTPHLQDVEFALVSDLFHDVTYTARRDRGASRNGREIKPSSISSLEDAVIGIDFNSLKVRDLITRLLPILEGARHLRHLGANALEVCYVADGTTDAFIDLRGKLRVTDIAAAHLILREVGGLMVTPQGQEMSVPLDASQRVSFIASANTQLHKVIMEYLTST
ncbi:MAG: Inositol-1-monophosphatase [Candidatus Bathyarchaeota archaeon BA1]|nr:MAG: Inositol-1-monophosphatase [Candidatus Bathyarchaeota archaeon BA1]